MTDINLLVVVLSCAKHSNLWEGIINRKLPNLIILCGGSSETKLEENILYLKCSDSYDGLSEKMMAAFEFIASYEPFKTITHILKADDHDTEFSKEQIEEITIKHKDILNSQDYVGQNLISTNYNYKTYHYGRTPTDSIWYNKPHAGYNPPFLAGGETYMFSRRSLNYLAENKEDGHTYCSYEDIMVATILLKYNIHPYKLDYGIKTWLG